MICEKCKKNEATVFYQETINGNKRSYSICAACAAAMEQQGEIAMGHGLFALPSLGGFHNDLFGSLFGSTDGQPRKAKACPACGATMSDLKKSGKVGCPECYVTFSEELGSTVRSIHGNVKHVGRAPAGFRKNREKQDRLLTLRQQMKDAVQNENFELAASLRDEIRTLEENR